MTTREKYINDKNNCDSISIRKKIMDELGGIPEVATVAKNDEWLYMLEEDTRHSVAIEGFFATEKEIKSILRGRKTGPEILNYFRTAQGLYDLGREPLTTEVASF